MMNVTVTTESRFVIMPDGSIWSDSGVGPNFWDRYTYDFNNVFILARCKSVEKPPSAARQVNHKNITIVPLPYYIGPTQMLRDMPRIYKSIRKQLANYTACILRVPSWIGAMSAYVAKQQDMPFALEVVGDPHDVFSPGANKHLGRPVFRWLFSHQLRENCKHACAVAYVTERALQLRYPPSSTSFTTHYSSIELPADAFVEKAPIIRLRNKPTKIITVGSLEHMYKGIDLIIDAVKINLETGIDLHLTVVGGGRHLKEMKNYATRLGVGEKVRFLGQLSHADVFKAVDNADLFVLASRQEGLPRAVIEAMSRGKACLGTRVGGTPELLHHNDLIPPNDVDALANKISSVAYDEARLREMGNRNLERAKSYASEVIAPRRREFYKFIKEYTTKHYGR